MKTSAALVANVAVRIFGSFFFFLADTHLVAVSPAAHGLPSEAYTSYRALAGADIIMPVITATGMLRCALPLAAYRGCKKNFKKRKAQKALTLGAVIFDLLD